MQMKSCSIQERRITRFSYSLGICLAKPFFAIRQLLPSAQLLKMRYYFDDYGCLKCGKSDGVTAAWNVREMRNRSAGAGRNKPKEAV